MFIFMIVLMMSPQLSLSMPVRRTLYLFSFSLHIL
ncbi:hypothetical protein GLYMA_08G032950v4 [Glycine max]|nr:hypothetical protein GLYMA_08G032950v4 [Glycine max]KAH1049433.1 hypothetical protein GYH30_020108 [Glycine max]